MGSENLAIATQSAAGVLPYWTCIDDYLLHLDGRITAGLELRGLYLECASEEKLNQIYQRLTSFLHSIEPDIELQFLYQVRPFSPLLTQFTESHKSSPEKYRFIWQQKAEFLAEESNVWHTKLFLFVTVPNQTREEDLSFLNRIIRSFKRTRLNNVLKMTSDWMDERVAVIHRTLRQIKMALAALEIPWRELSAKDQEGLIYELMNPTRAHQIPYCPQSSAAQTNHINLLSERLVFSNIQCFPRQMILDDVLHRIITLKDIPQMQYVGLINRLLSLREFPFDVVMGVRVSDPDATLNALKRSENINANLQTGDRRNHEAEQKQEVLSEVIQELVRGDTKCFSVSFAIRYSARTLERLDHVEGVLRQAIHQCGEAKELREEFSYPESFVATLPGSSYLFENKRTLNTITPQALSLLPVYQANTGAATPVALFKTRTDELVAVDPFNTKLAAWNAIIFGPTGRGKSFLAQYLLLQYMRINPRLIIVDIGGSYRRFTELIGGQYLSFNKTTGTALNPFLDVSGDPEPEFIAFLSGVIERMVKNEGDAHLDKIEKHLIRNCIRTLYSARPFELNLEGLRQTMEAIAAETTDSEDKQLLKRLAKRLKLFTEGEGRHLFIGKNSVSLECPVITIDLAGLSANRELQGIVVQILTGLIWRQISTTQGPKLVLFDEAWQHMKDPTAAELLDMLYRTARKHHAGVISISQQLEEFLNPEIQTSIVANSASRFILRTDRELDLLKKVFQLNDTELDVIRSLSMRRGYYSEVFAAIGDDHHCLRIEPSPYEYWLCTTHPDDLKAEQDFISKNPQMDLKDRIQALASAYPRGVNNET